MLNWRQLLLILFAMLFSVTVSASGEGKGKFYGAKPTEYPTWFKESFLDFREDVSEATAAGKRLLVLFHQRGCPYCNTLVERNLAQKDIEQTIRKNFDVVPMNLWGDKEVISITGKKTIEKTFAEDLHVQFTPTLLFFDEQGKIVLRLNGYLPPDRFRLALDYVARHEEQKHSYRDYVSARQPPASSGQLHNEDFFQSGPVDLRRKTGNQKPFAIFFEQKDCPNCTTLHSKVLIDKETRKIIRQFDVVQLDMWSNTKLITHDGKTLTARELAKQLDIKYAPTMVLFDPSGREVIRSEAFFKVFHTQGIFHYVLSGAYKSQPSFQRYLSERARQLQQQGKDVDIWRQGDEAVGQGG